MHRFLCPNVLVVNAEVTLSAEESIHLARVLRLKVGDEVQLFDGKGTRAQAVLVAVSPKQSTARVLSVERVETASKVHLVFALPKPPALEFILRRCTEIGVASFQPVLTQHSFRMDPWNDTRWKKILLEVCKQCQSPFAPDLLSPKPLESWLNSREKRPLLFCHEEQREAQAELPRNSMVDLLVGAEGGWSPRESELLLSQGAILFGLGENRLRAETAALVSTVLVKSWVGEMKGLVDRPTLP